MMIEEARITIRNAGFLLAQRGAYITGSLLFAVIVPRLMGPNHYGRYALITSLYLWFVMASDLGYSEVMGRYVPYFTLQGEEEKLRKFFSNLLAVSLACGIVSAGLFLFFTALWLRDFDLSLLVTMAATLLVRAGARLFFVLFLGLNRASRWGMGEILRHSFLFVFVIIGYSLNALGGALQGILLSELIVLSIGAYWARSYLSWKDLRLDISYLIPYLKFGFMFFMFNLLASASQHSGAVLVRFFYPDYAQVGYFGLAYSVYFTISMVIPQFTIAFTPLLISLQTQGKINILRQWIEQLINGLTVGGVFVVFGVLLLGNNLVPLVLGAAYRPVTANLFPLSLTLWVQILSSVAILLTVVYNYPKATVVSGVIRLAALWIAGPFLIAKWGSLGGCFAVLLASAICASYLTWRMKRVIRYSLKKWASIIALGFIFLPLLRLQASWSINVLLYAVFVVGYCTILILLRIITFSQVVAVGRAFHSKNAMFDVSKSPVNEYLDG